MRNLGTGLLHDNYRIKDSVIIALKQDKNTIIERSKSDKKVQESFLSCNALYSNYLESEKPQNISVQQLQVAEIAENPLENYRAENIVFRSFSAKKLPSDGPAAHELTRYILAIDPGVKGALALLKVGPKPSFQTVYDMPTYTLRVSNKDRQRVDLTALSLLLDLYRSSIILALIEDVASMPSDGHVGAFSFGFSTGGIHGALSMAGIKIEKVKPAVWKASMGLDSDKDKSIKLALKLFPEAQNYLTKKSHDGRAEAILLGLFAFKHLRKA